ncbi:myo-inositol-1(or 4)-monophosphatase [Motilibacter peucedani]|uniref:Inositol-1-monophosphatase n=1 Tax=Motilibacter peucedani TaxID=598650 RepID=A0A420XRX8_9ACTN|nr:inositol monophosphatase family protein [Motilibacter peucedani]RKS77624.1 myo-inositol-1(or 4)-monophosphatase [Motilibacter peucedani]
MTTPDAPRPDDLLALALEAARAATRLLVDERPADLRVTAKSSPTDPVTEMDRASERLVVETVRAARPGDGFFGEEGSDSAGTTGVVWVVDPIDGTVNYLYGLPHWSVSIAAEVDGTVVAGVVAAPVLGETFVATQGGGAFVERADGSRRRLQVTEDVPLERALVGTGFGYAAERRAAQGAVLARLLPQVRDIRRNGSAALDLCDLAAGRLDAYYERGVNRWDTAAAALVAREAGARVGGLRGEPDSPQLTAAAAPALFERLVEVLAGLGADAG